ncbi:MAG: sodium:alanine symporter family protein [Lachnospiraceae bacterium]|nr:sodium:alanine symporter family protein [Lachnospiraceae bacterium]
MELLVKINSVLNGFVWGSPMLIFLILTGLVLSVFTGFFQFSHIGHWLKETLGSIGGKGHFKNDVGSVSQYRVFCASLCATIGTGNIVGVSTAICLGGPGAVFWMWVAGFLGMMIKYSENVLGMYYRRRNSEGAWSGGPMYYLEEGLGSLKHCKKLGKFLGVCFCIFTIFASFGIGNMAQINRITINFSETFLYNWDSGSLFGISNIYWAIGLFLMFAAGYIIIGGFRRLGAFSEIMTPFMVIAYFLGCLLVIIFNIEEIPKVFLSIFRFAFGPKAVAGGVSGSVIHMILNTMRNGFKSGIFSNESGFGSSVLIHCNTCAREPVNQGMWGIAEVFLDTIVICTMTALVVLSCGAIDLNTGLVKVGVNDATLVTKAFGDSFGKAGEGFVVIMITLFAFTSVLGWSYYGSKVTEYLFGVTFSKLYRILFIILIILGAVMDHNISWDISDTFNGLMIIPNLIGLILQLPMLVKLTGNYIDRKIKKKDIEPMLSFDQDIQRDSKREVEEGMD